MAKTTVCSPGESATRSECMLISAAAECDGPPDELDRSQALAGKLGQSQGRAAGSVFLGAVMPLDDGDVGRVAERAGGLAHQPHQEIDGPAHVGSDQDRDPIGVALRAGALARRRNRWCRRRAGCRRSAQTRAIASEPSGSEKSIMTSILRSEGNDELSGTPSGETAARLPASSPRCGCPARSMRRDELERGIAGDELDQARAHAAGRTMDADGENRLGHAVDVPFVLTRSELATDNARIELTVRPRNRGRSSG